MHVKSLTKHEGTMLLRTTIQESIPLMQDQQIRKDFGNRIKQMRKQKKWSQKQLAEKIDVRFAQLNKYEGGLHMPPAEKLLLLAEVFNTTIDYLLTGDPPKELLLHNTRLLKRFEEVQNFTTTDQEAIIAVLDAMIVKHRVQGAVQSVDKPKKAATG